MTHRPVITPPLVPPPPPPPPPHRSGITVIGTRTGRFNYVPSKSNVGEHAHDLAHDPAHGPDCDCPCHAEDEPNERVLGANAIHPGRDCTQHLSWLGEEVYCRISSWQNVTYRHDVSTGITRADWLDMSPSDRDEVLLDTLAQHVQIEVLDDPTEIN